MIDSKKKNCLAQHKSSSLLELYLSSANFSFISFCIRCLNKKLLLLFSSFVFCICSYKWYLFLVSFQCSKNIRPHLPCDPNRSNHLPASFQASEMNLQILDQAIYWYDSFWFSTNQNCFQFLLFPFVYLNATNFACLFWVGGRGCRGV